MAIPRKLNARRRPFDRTGRTGLIIPHPAAELQPHPVETRPEVSVLKSQLRDEARLEGVHLAAREIAHLLNNDLAVAVSLVDLLQAQTELPAELRPFLESAATSLDAAAHHIKQLQSVVRVVVKETPAGQSLDLERSQPAHQ